MIQAVVSTEAEDSTRLLNLTLAAHQDSMNALRSIRTPPRLSGTFDSEQVQRQATLLRLVSIAEEFAAETLRAIAEPWSAGADQSVKDVWAKQLDRELNGWKTFPDAYARRLGVKKDVVRWNTMDGYTHARNAVAHGLGRLTPRQRDQDTRSKLAAIGVTMTGDRIILTEDTLVKTCDACRDFIERLDLAVERR